MGSRLIAHRIRTRAWLGAMNGLVFGMGLSTVYLVVPYIGLYPNLVTLVIAMNLIDGKYGNLSFDMTVLVGNLIIYPSLFALVYHNQPKPLPPRHCRNCGYNLTGNVSGRCPECGQIDWMPEL